MYYNAVGSESKLLFQRELEKVLRQEQGIGFLENSDLKLIPYVKIYVSIIWSHLTYTQNY